MKKLSTAATPLFAALLIVGMQMAPAVSHAQDTAQKDNNIHAALVNSLKNSKFKDVHVAVKDGVVDLTGSVETFAVKEEADHRAHNTKNVAAVDNRIEIEGAGDVSDADLAKKLGREIQYDRVGYFSGTDPRIRDVTPFNAISVQVQDGVVTLGGHAYGPVDASSAYALAANTKGVRDVINDITVDPVSPNDDRIRIAVYRSVYGFPSLNKYAIDPGKPIRITVVNGKVTLSGEVDNQADKNAAGIRANSVAGVFSVTNDLQVAGRRGEK